jgi:hypothetical protein
MSRRVTLSRNSIVSLSRTSECCCKYRAFQTHRAPLYSPDEVESVLDLAVRRRAKELLDPGQLIAAAHGAGRPAAERRTFDEIRRPNPA